MDIFTKTFLISKNTENSSNSLLNHRFDAVENNKVLARHITKLLLAIGFSPRHFGFAYIREMILLLHITDEKKLTTVYQSIAVLHGQPSEAVQTAVRTALKTAQLTDSFAKLETLFGAKFIEPRYALAPREFIGIINEYLNFVWDGKEELTAA